MFCPECKTEYVDGVTVCEDCGAALVEKLPDDVSKATWSFSGKSDGLPWPQDEKGRPEKAVFLTHCTCVNMEDKMLRNMLCACGIPCITAMPENGTLGKVVLGMSGTGVDLYVPASKIDEARSLIGGNAHD